MKSLALTCLLLAALLPAARAELDPAVLKRAKSRVESLLGNRRGASPTPVNPANPFELPVIAPLANESPVTTSDVPLTKNDALAKLAASLNVSGFVQIQDVPHLVINRLPYRENDLIPVRDSGGRVVFLRLKKITTVDFILEIDDVELLLKHTEK